MTSYTIAKAQGATHVLHDEKGNIKACGTNALVLRFSKQFRKGDTIRSIEDYHKTYPTKL